MAGDHMPPMTPRVLILGNPRETHVGRHLFQGAEAVGVAAEIMDVETAYEGPRLLRALFWRFAGRRPLRLARFSAQLVDRCIASKPDLVLSTGLAPVTDAALSRLKTLGVPTANFLTDDPWNEQHRAPWFMRAMAHYDHIFSPRQANLEDLSVRIGRKCSYLPFGYAPDVHYRPTMKSEEMLQWRSEVLFIGGGDDERAAVMQRIKSAGFDLSLWGGYWSKMSGLREFAHGHAGPVEFRKLVACAAVNLCLVRRANRDGHSMRSFEMPAVGGCLLVEDTQEHRAIFGRDDVCVRYFRSGEEMVVQIRRLIDDVSSQQRLAMACHTHICHESKNSYADRLAQITDVLAQI